MSKPLSSAGALYFVALSVAFAISFPFAFSIESSFVEQSKPTKKDFLNRPGFSGECFVHHSGCFFKLVVLLAECVLLFVRCLVADGTVQSVLVASMHPFHGFSFKPAFGFPPAEMLDDFGREQSDDGFGQGVVAAVPDASDGHVDSGFGEPIGVSDGQLPHASVRMVGQSSQRRTPSADGLVEGVEDEAGCHRGRDAPSDDLPSEDVDDESGAGHSHRGVHVGEVGDPELIGGVGLELAVDLVLGAWPGPDANRHLIMAPFRHSRAPGEEGFSGVDRSRRDFRAGPPSSRRSRRQTLGAPDRPPLSSWTLRTVARVSASFLDRSDAFPGSRATAACA